MLKRIFLTCSLTVVLASGCDDVIDLEPQESAPAEYILSSAQNVEAAILGVYGRMLNDRLYGQQILLYGDVIADNVNVSLLNQDDMFGQVALHNTNLFNTETRPMWTQGYEAIANANYAIDAIDRGIVQGASQATLQRWRAEALFLRAAIHFDLVRYFAQPYSNGNGSQKGIVLRVKALTTEEANTPTPLNTVAEVHNQVIADLQAAAAVLPATNGNRATSWAAKALLARVYFNMNRHADAFATANDVIANGGFSFTGTPINQFRTGGNVAAHPAVIFQFVYSGTPDIAGKTRPASGFLPVTQGSGSLLADLEASGPNDLRSSTTFLQVGTDSRTYFRKWDVNGAPMNIPYLRLAEMHLIRAESGLQANPTANLQTAIDSYNAIRSYYVSGYTPLTTGTTNSAALLNLVQRERRIELAYEGDRFHDLRRRQLNVRDKAYDDSRLYITLPIEELGNGNL